MKGVSSPLRLYSGTVRFRPKADTTLSERASCGLSLLDSVLFDQWHSQRLFLASGILDRAPVAFDHVVNRFLLSRRTLKEENGLPSVLNCNHPDLAVASDRRCKA